ncbi:MAG: hypothetical protein K9I48_07175 [Sphingobacteriales bacterium]|nr:hypothetical protein [Sphingobacteriales bacterium]
MKKNLLRTLLVSTILVSATFFAACDENAGIVIGIPQTQEVVYKIDPFTGISLSRVDTVESDLDSLLTANGATREDIDGIDLTNLTLSLTDSNGTLATTQNFNNVKSMNISVGEIGGFLTAMGNWDSTTMATTYQNLNPITEPNLTVSSPFSLLTYLSKPSFRVELNGKLNNPITSTIYIKTTMTINIKVKI